MCVTEWTTVETERTKWAACVGGTNLFAFHTIRHTARHTTRHTTPPTTRRTIRHAFLCRGFVTGIGTVPTDQTSRCADTVQQTSSCK